VVKKKKKFNSVITVGYSIINKTATVNDRSLMPKYGGGGHRAGGTCQVAFEDTDRIVNEILAAVR
jgi:nanoRNase/pAp phosphatase (c-di-AMP/oligoRNAs hydrolase)